MTSNKITLPSPAKLNLFLHITGRRDDGYHKLQTLFQFIDICDELTFTLTHKNTITLLNPIEGVNNQDNLIYKAACKLQPYRINKDLGVEINLTKKLPMGGGIGGGSSNAATTLLALNQLWQCQLSFDELAKIGVELGADIPIFIFGKSAFAEGIGEKLTEIHPMEPHYLLLKPNCNVQTSAIFADKNLTRDTPAIKISHALTLEGQNDCLDVVRKHNPEVNEAYNWLTNQADAKLTGTGACIFATFNTIDDLLSVKERVPKKWQTWACQGCNLSPTHIELNQWIEKFGV